MITVYLDESRHTDPNSYMVVAGFWGKKEQWDALIPDWMAALGKRQSLHMRTLRLNSERGAKRAEKLLAKLGPLPYKHGLSPVYGAVKTSDYMDLIAGSYLEAQLPGYVVCLTAVMQRLSRIIPAHESITIICEINKRYEAIATQSFRQVSAADPISRPDRPYFSGIEFIPKNTSVLTQPSDFLAYAIAEAHEDQTSQKTQLTSTIAGPAGKVLGLTLKREDIRRMALNVKSAPLYKILTGKAWHG